MLATALIVISFLGMEIFSWAFHKYLMHGLLWSIHKTHHGKHNSYFELNDIFSLFFGGIAILLIFLGLENFDYRFWIGCGITLYGFVYFILHDIFIHRRIKSWSRPASLYFDGLAQAHRDHHKSNQKNDSVSFGLLMVPYHYFKNRQPTD